MTNYPHLIAIVTHSPRRGLMIKYYSGSFDCQKIAWTHVINLATVFPSLNSVKKVHEELSFPEISGLQILRIANLKEYEE